MKCAFSFAIRCFVLSHFEFRSDCSCFPLRMAKKMTFYLISNISSRFRGKCVHRLDFGAISKLCCLHIKHTQRATRQKKIGIAFSRSLVGFLPLLQSKRKMSTKHYQFQLHAKIRVCLFGIRCNFDIFLNFPWKFPIAISK